MEKRLLQVKFRKHAAKWVREEGVSENICFIVSSVIYFAPQPLSYVKTRSVFTPEERAAQTLETFSSIRARLPNAKIVLVEAGNRPDLPLELAKHADYYFYVGSNPLVRLACNSPYKGLGEIAALLAAASRIKELGDFFFKISGRYCLTDNFDADVWNPDCFNVFKYGENNKHMSTKLYGFPKTYFALWRSALIKTAFFMFGQRKEIEHFLPKFLPKEHLHLLSQLGVGGELGPYGSFVEE